MSDFELSRMKCFARSRFLLSFCLQIIIIRYLTSIERSSILETNWLNVWHGKWFEIMLISNTHRVSNSSDMKFFSLNILHVQKKNLSFWWLRACLMNSRPEVCEKICEVNCWANHRINSRMFSEDESKKCSSFNAGKLTRITITFSFL